MRSQPVRHRADLYLVRSKAWLVILVGVLTAGVFAAWAAAVPPSRAAATVSLPDDRLSAAVLADRALHALGPGVDPRVARQHVDLRLDRSKRLLTISVKRFSTIDERALAAALAFRIVERFNASTRGSNRRHASIYKPAHAVRAWSPAFVLAMLVCGGLTGAGSALICLRRVATRSAAGPQPRTAS